MKWYCCLNEAGLVGLGEPAIVAARSCIRNTSLQPNLIYSGPRNAFSEYMESIGVTVHYRQVSFLDDILSAKPRPGFSIHSATGSYLRYEIANIDQSDDVVIYTDADVIFHRPLPEFLPPKILAAAPEYTISVTPPKAVSSVLNSGVMLLNLPAYRAELSRLLKCCRDNDFYFRDRGVGGFYDQGALNMHFKGRWDRLPQHMNWRPFVKDQDPPTIIHFHGTKPYEIRKLMETGNADFAMRTKLYNLAPQNYQNTMEVYCKYIDPIGIKALQRSANVFLSQ